MPLISYRGYQGAFASLNRHFNLSPFLFNIQGEIMPKYKFRMMGLPPNQGTKFVNVPKEATCKDAKSLLRNAYKIHQALVVQLIFKGQPISDNDVFSKKMQDLGHKPEKDTITIITQQAGGWIFQ